MGVPTIQPRSSSKPMTSNKSTRPRVVQRPAAHENDDQVGGGPTIVSPEILRLQANRPDERQQRQRRRVISPPTSDPETTGNTMPASESRKRQDSKPPATET